MKHETVAQIQRAGTALHRAQQMLASEAGVQEIRVKELMSSDAFDLSSDDQFEHWKLLARMAQTVQSMEEQLKQIYLAAERMGGDRSFSLPGSLDLAPSLGHVVIDAEVRGPQPVTKPSEQSGKRPKKRPELSLRRPQGNAAKTLKFMQRHLNSKDFKRVTHAELSESVPLSLGSVGAAVSALLKLRLLEEGAKGHYKLA